jgi:hypothetical protein
MKLVLLNLDCEIIDEINADSEDAAIFAANALMFELGVRKVTSKMIDDVLNYWVVLK